MADLSNNSSFIPKRGPAKQRRAAQSRRVYAFTIISYVLMFATLLSVGGVYFYSAYLERQRDVAIEALNAEIQGFDETKMQQVLSFNERLTQAAGRLNNSVSLVSVFEALEAATINTVQIAALGLTREDDDSLLLTATVGTDSFDSTIFQRGVFNRNEVIESITIADVQLQAEDDEAGGEPAAGAVETPQVTFTAEIVVPVSAVPYEVGRAEAQPLTILSSEPAADAPADADDAAAAGEPDDNEADI